MKRILTICLAIAALTVGATAQEKKAAAPAKKLELKDLPPAVQKTIQDQSKGAEIKSISKETEEGQTQFEVETMLNGKRRDFNVDTKGALLVVEEETTIGSIPAPAKAAILKKVADGKLGMVELFKRGGETMYEAAEAGSDGQDNGGVKRTMATAIPAPIPRHRRRVATRESGSSGAGGHKSAGAHSDEVDQSEAMLVRTQAAT